MPGGGYGGMPGGYGGGGYGGGGYGAGSGSYGKYSTALRLSVNLVCQRSIATVRCCD